MRWMKTKECSILGSAWSKQASIVRTQQDCRREMGLIQSKRIQNAEKAHGVHLEDMVTQL